MRIRAFHIDGFGMLRDVEADDLPCGCAVFLGRNEAGKSTLLDFFRAVLTGYPLRPRERERAYTAAGQSGGSLLLETDFGPLRLARHPGAGGGEPVLSAPDGAPLDGALWERLLGGVTREVYASIYGFSLSELQAFSSLTSDGVRNALYGASFGMGLRSPGRALKRLEAEMDKLFKPGGSKQQISLLLREWEDAGRQLREVEEDAVRYDALAAEREEKLAELESVRLEIRTSAAEKRSLERRLGVWRQWEQWRLAEVRLGRLEEVPATFPPDGPARLERAENHRENVEREAALALERADRTRMQLAALAVNPDLAACADRLRDLGEGKTSYRNALAEIPRLNRALERCGEEQENLLRTLGAAWTLERVKAADRPLHARETLSRRAEEMHFAVAAHEAASSALEKTRHDEAAAREALAEAARRLEKLPVPAAELDAAARDELQRLLAAVNEARQRLPEREKALEQARGEFNRALSHLHLRPRHSTADALDALSAAQDEVAALAGEVLARMDEAAEAGRAVERARDEEGQARARLERVRNRRDDLDGPDRAALENRRTALRRLRAAVAMLPMERDAAAEAEDRWAAHMADSPSAGRHPLLVIPGALLALGGGAIIASVKFWNLHTLQIGADFTWPLALWHGYLVLSAGVAFMAAGLPRNRPEASRHAVAAEQLRARREAAEKKLTAREAEVSRLCALVGLEAGEEGPQPAALDALESELDRDREQCAANERLEEELAEHAADLESVRLRVRREEEVYARKKSEAHSAQRRWHERLMDFGVQSVPTPEAASAYFARVDSARAVWASVAALEKEVAAMEARSPRLAEAARRLLPESSLPASWAPGPVAEAVRMVLESCRLADLAAEERAAAAEAVRAAENLSERETRALSHAVTALEESALRLDEARQNWREALAALDLEEELSPATAAEALQCLDRVLSLESERGRLEDALSHRQRERDALEMPLREIAERLGRLPKDGPEGPDWPDLLDALRREAESACRAEEEQARLQALLVEQEGEQRVAQGLVEDARREADKLLRLAGATDGEDFLRRFAVKSERDELIRRREDLEDALRLAAGETDFQRYVDGFAETEKETLEARTAELSVRLAASAAREEELADEERTLRVRLEGLAASGRAAELRQSRAASAESLRRLGLEWGRNALARHLLNQAKQRFEKQRQPEVIRIASNLFRSITNGAWAGISASLEDSSLRVLPSNGEAVSPELLSRGAREQLYLALRLAHMRSHAARAAALPVIMDDILVNFDPLRAERTAAVFEDMTRPGEGAPGHQILFFTCHPHLADLLQRVIPDSVLYTVERGRVARA